MTEHNVESITRVRADELRREAAVARRAAGVKTSGSGGVDQILVVLAEQLERHAAFLEQEGQGP